MSCLPVQAPIPATNARATPSKHVIVPRGRHLAGFQVRRALPSAHRRKVGPFIFLDQIGPAEFLIGGGIDIRPHPHIGLATVIYLFEGEVFHRDSLGTEVAIRPGEVNLMTAGRGIVHSERETTVAKQRKRRLFGIQVWCALLKSHEETAPAFVPHGTGELPRIEGEGKRVRLVMGAAYGERSPVDLPHEALPPRRCWRRARCCRSTPTTTSAPSISRAARSTSWASGLPTGGCSCSIPATAFHFWL
jgi:redox-sensitive bicupin YhaK (pirin superfamily)